MRYVYASLAGTVGAVVAAFTSAVLLGIANIYLTGHGVYWPSEEFEWQFVRMSLLDLVMVGVSLLVFARVFYVVLNAQKS